MYNNNYFYAVNTDKTSDNLKCKTTASLGRQHAVVLNSHAIIQDYVCGSCGALLPTSRNTTELTTKWHNSVKHSQGPSTTVLLGQSGWLKKGTPKIGCS